MSRYLAQMKKKRDERKAKGLCVICGEPARMEKTWCKTCFEKSRASRLASAKKYQAAHLDKSQSTSRNAMRGLYRTRKDAGLCPRCGKRKPEIGYAACSQCRKKAAANAKKAR